MGAVYHDSPETLLALMLALPAQVVVGQMCIRDRIQKAQQLQYKLMKISCLLLEKIHK